MRGAALALAFALGGVVARPLGAQETPTSVSTLRTLAQALAPKARVSADSFITRRVKGDSLRAYVIGFTLNTADWETRASQQSSTPFPRIPARRYGVKEAYHRVLPTDHPGARFYVAALRGETNPWILRTMLRRHGIHPLLIRHRPFEDFLVRVIGTSTDSALTFTAIGELGQLRATRDFAQLGERLLATHTAAGSVPTWLARAHQDAYEAWLGTRIPAYLHTPPPVFAALPATPSAIRVLAFGDWGTGDSAQYTVAAAMRAYHARAPFTLGITLGDNFYTSRVTGPVPQSPYHPRWQQDYEQQYGVMGIPFYASVGNHEYVEARDLLFAEHAYGAVSKTWHLPALQYTYTAGPAQFFVLDLGEGTMMAPEYVEWLDRELGKSTARWKIVYGHFPTYDANNYMADVMQELVEPLLRKHHVDLYLNGHTHALQHWAVNGTDYVTSGNGAGNNSKLQPTSDPRMQYGQTIPGFSVLDIDATTLTHRFVGADGRTLYEFTRRK